MTTERRRRSALGRRYGRSAGLRSPPAPGTRVRLTSAFLQSTGQGHGARRVFKVIGQDRVGSVLVDEPLDPDFRKRMWSYLPEGQRPKWRSINLAHLERVDSRPRLEAAYL